ncbi:MAG: leucine-rich repeat protein [Christensenellales bacterium]
MKNLKVEYKAVKDGKEVSIYYLEKANVFTTVKLYVGIDEDGKIVNMVTTQSDTLGKGESFNGSSMGLNGATSTTVDDSFVVVSGATVSSNTVKDLITIAFDKFMNDNPDLFPVKTLTVTFDSNGGTLVKEIEVKSGSTFVRPNDPTRSLYHFVGWYFNDQPYDFTKPVTSNITLVAKWVSVFQFDSKTQTIVDATDLAGDIEIPAKINGVEVKALGENLFKNNKTITSVIIPEGIENIAFSAFEGCSNLKTVTFLGTDSSDPLTFGINVFKDCTALNSISLPANATAIATSMFEGCTSLIQLPIHGVLDHIGTSAFKNCVQLAAISLPEGVKSIESNAFENCQSLIAISFPSTLTKISEEAFKNCSQIVSLYIPQGVTNINLNAFLGCEKLSSIQCEC